MGLAETVSSIIAPGLVDLGVELVDVEHKGVVVRIVVDEPGGIDLDRLGEVTQRVSHALDDADPIAGRYTLEVSSPGVERPLRRPSHFRAVVGQTITFKTDQGGKGTRLTGELLGADDDGIEVRTEPARPGEEPAVHRLAYGAVDRARTVFEWGPPPKPGKGSKPGSAKKAARQDRRRDEHEKSEVAGGGSAAAAKQPAPPSAAAPGPETPTAGAERE